MEKSSSNIKHFWNFFSRGRGKSYTLPRENCLTENGEQKFVNGSIINNVTNCSAENMRYHKSKINDVSGCDRKRVRAIVDKNFIKCQRIYNHSYCLPIFTPISCSICMIIVIAALFGTSWISTEEKIPSSEHDFSSFFYHKSSSNITLSYIIKSSNASLWIICTRLVAITENHIATSYGIKNCTRIDHLDIEKYQPDPLTNEPANVIPYTIILSLPIFIVSFVIMMISYMLFLVAICASKKYKIFYFVAGIGFIISGLVMLLGLIMFISIFKSESYHKLRSTALDPPFSFQYGHSFILYVMGFIFVELAGMLNICLFNKLQKEADNFYHQNRTLNNMTIKHDQVDISNNHPPPRLAFAMGNGFVPYGVGENLSNCSHHHHHHQPQQHHYPNSYDAFHHVIFTRNASTSTLDLDSSGSSEKNRKHFNNICGINVRLNKSKQCNQNLKQQQQQQRIKSAKNIYYIKDSADSCEPKIFIVDPRFHKNRKCALQKSLEDIRMHNNRNISHVRQQHLHHHHRSGGRACMNNLTAERSVKTLPRDFSRPKCRYRPSLESFLDNFPHDDNGENSGSISRLNRVHHSQNNLCNLHHYKSFDELSTTQKACRNFYCEPYHHYQWPKIISKSSYSINNFPYDDGMIEEFDLERIERERRKSHTNLFEKQNELNYGTAV